MNRVPWELSLDAPISIRAEGAWRVTRGSPDVTVAIIDDGFDLPQLKAGTVAHLAQVPGCKWPAVSSGHGTAVAGLIGGTRDGYPGVAPGCRLLLIALPAICSPSEQAAAFHIARNAGAAVVCCAWGVPHAPTTDLQEAISRLSHEGRNGRGALVLSAAPNRDRLIDGWSSSLATPVSGVTADGVGLPTYKHSLRAPVSDAARAIGGEPGLPEGTSGATALAAGAVGLVFSANPALSSGEALHLLQESTPNVGVLDSFAAVSRSRARVSTRRGGVRYAPPRIRPPAVQSQGARAYHERRFNGGEHCFLGFLAGRAFGNMWAAAGNDPAKALFAGALAPFNPNGFRAQFKPHVATLLQGLISPAYGPVIGSVVMPTKRIQYGSLLGLAGDICATPEGLEHEIDRPISQITSILDIFINKEWTSGPVSFNSNFNFEQEFDLALVLQDLASTQDDVNYVALFLDNPGHFGGDNLLYYLSYHLVAVAEATRCAGETNPVIAEQRLKGAVLSEAFAGHFLADMFSASHSRVPRWAFLYLYQNEKERGNFVSRVLHQHEGRLGLYLTNAIGQVWYAYGDTGVMRGTGVFQLATPALDPLGRTGDPVDAFRYIGKESQMRSYDLAASLIYTSLIDVLRHCAEGLTPDMSAQGGATQPGGLLRYILERMPYALSDLGLSSAIRTALAGPVPQSSVDNMSMYARLLDREAFYETYCMIREGLTGYLTTKLSGFHFWTRTGFERGLFAGSFDSFAAEGWSATQINHLKPHLAPPAGVKILAEVPRLVWKAGFPIDSPRLKEAIDTFSIPDSWRAAVPPALLAALATEIWRVD